MIKLRILGLEDYPRLSGWVQSNHKVLKREEQESKPQRDNMMIDTEVRKERFEDALLLGLKMGGKHLQGIQAASGS